MATPQPAFTMYFVEQGNTGGLVAFGPNTYADATIGRFTVGPPAK